MQVHLPKFFVKTNLFFKPTFHLPEGFPFFNIRIYPVFSMGKA